MQSDNLFILDFLTPFPLSQSAFLGAKGGVCAASPISCHPAVLEVALEASQIALIPFCQLQTCQTPKAPGRESNY